MIPLAAALALAVGATHDVPAGAPLAPVLAVARPGDVVRLGPGRHAATLGSLAGPLRVEGAGAGVTRIAAPDGEDGAVVRGAVSLAGLSLETGAARCALKVLGGAATLDDVALAGGACGAFVEAGRLTGRRVTLGGEYALLVRGGEAELAECDARGTSAGVAVLGGGAATLRRCTVTGPAREAGVTVARGTARLEAVVVRAPGPAGLWVSHGGTLEGTDVVVAGATEEGGALGTCAQVLRGTLRLDGALLVGCAGAALEAAGGEVRLRATDATGGGAGCLVLVDGAAARLEGNVCTGQGPGLVVVGRSAATLVANRWLTEPPAWIDCAGGARLELGRGETLARPCVRVP